MILSQVYLTTGKILSKFSIFGRFSSVRCSYGKVGVTYGFFLIFIRLIDFFEGMEYFVHCKHFIRVTGRVTGIILRK